MRAEEDFKGSVTSGKVADFVVLSHDLINCTDDEILSSKVLLTMVNGQIKYQVEEF